LHKGKQKKKTYIKVWKRYNAQIVFVLNTSPQQRCQIHVTRLGNVSNCTSNKVKSPTIVSKRRLKHLVSLEIITQLDNKNFTKTKIKLVFVFLSNI